jgi:hypothetical protein
MLINKAVLVRRKAPPAFTYRTFQLAIVGILCRTEVTAAPLTLESFGAMFPLNGSPARALLVIKPLTTPTADRSIIRKPQAMRHLLRSESKFYVSHGLLITDSPRSSGAPMFA